MLNKKIKSFWNPRSTVQKDAKSGYKRMFGDYDRDGALNIFDCKPINKRQKGLEHNWSRNMMHRKIVSAESVEDEIIARKFKQFGKEPKEIEVKKRYEEIGE